MNFRKSLVTAALLASLTPFSQANAQDDVFDTGTTARDYNYVQILHILNQEEIDFPFVFNIQITVMPSVTFRAQYTQIGISNQRVVADNGLEIDVSATAKGARAGFGYHRASERWTKIDWIAGLEYEQIEVEAVGSPVALPTLVITDVTKTNSLVSHVGIRGSITPELEAQILAEVDYTDDEFGDPVIDITAVYRFAPQFDLALSAGDVAADSSKDEEINYQVGLRYSW